MLKNFACSERPYGCPAVSPEHSKQVSISHIKNFKAFIAYAWNFPDLGPLSFISELLDLELADGSASIRPLENKTYSLSLMNSSCSQLASETM